MFLSLDGTLFVQLINFAIFFALLNVVFLRPVGRAIAKRRDYINGLVSDYDRYQDEAQNLREEAESDPRRRAPRGGAPRRRGAGRGVERSRRNVDPIRGASKERDRRGAEDRRRRSSTRRAPARRDAVRRLADVMLDRVIPEAGEVNRRAVLPQDRASGARSFRRSSSSACSSTCGSAGSFRSS